MIVDPTVTMGNLLSIVSILLAFIGMWLRSEKLLATLSIRIGEAERRLTDHDVKHAVNDAWHLNHVTSHNKSA